MAFKAYVLSPSNHNHGGYFVMRVPPYFKSINDASNFVGTTVNKLRKAGIVVEEWWVVPDSD